jgi:hypothetical protein
MLTACRRFVSQLPTVPACGRAVHISLTAVGRKKRLFTGLERFRPARSCRPQGFRSHCQPTLGGRGLGRLWSDSRRRLHACPFTSHEGVLPVAAIAEGTRPAVTTATESHRSLALRQRKRLPVVIGDPQSHLAIWTRHGQLHHERPILSAADGHDARCCPRCLVRKRSRSARCRHAMFPFAIRWRLPRCPLTPPHRHEVSDLNGSQAACRQ